MRKLVLPFALLGMALLLGAAVVGDCVRLAGGARDRVELADAEMKKHEERFVNLLATPPEPAPELPPAILNYRESPTSQDRHAAFDRLVTDFRQTAAGKVDPTNPLARKFMDDVAGAMNRRDVAQKQYDEEDAAYRAYLATWRGAVARTFSSRARADW